MNYPPTQMESGFYSRYFAVPKKDGGLRLILDLCHLNLALRMSKFKMLTIKSILSQIQPRDWFVTINLKDAYFHIQIVKKHRKFLRFAFEGKAYQYCVLAFWLARTPLNIHKVYRRSSGPTSAPWRQDFELPRRLVDSNPIAGSGAKTSRLSAQSFSKSGTKYESTEERSATQPTNYVSGGGHGFSYDAGMPISRTCAVVTDLSQSVQDRASGAHGLMSQIIVYDVGSVPCSSVGPAPHATVSVVDQEPEGFISLQSALQDHCDAQGLPRSETVEKISVPPERSPVGSMPSSQDYNDRRIPYGLRGGPSRMSSAGNLVRETAELAYKSDKVPVDQSGSHPRSPELRCRPALETEARGRGMETSPSSGEYHMAEVRTSGCGSVCFEHDYTLPTLVHPVSPVASRSGCAGPRMAQNQAVCFSPCLTALSNYIKN